MDVENMNRAYLETLSFSDLVSLADEYGVEVPENLDRRFLIAELLELAEEAKRFDGDMIISYDEKKNQESLPKNYNETQISCVLRNPAWAFVFWNISESDSLMLKKLPGCTMMLRVCSLSASDQQVPDEAFEINISSESQEQDVLLPTGKKFIKIELVYVSASSGKVLAFTPVIEIPQGSKLLNDYQPGMNDDFSPVIKLSGIEKVLTDQYKNHRHSFS